MPKMDKVEIGLAYARIVGALATRKYGYKAPISDEDIETLVRAYDYEILRTSLQTGPSTSHE